MKLSKDRILYIENICKELIKNLKATQRELEHNQNHIFTSVNRAKFKILRVELLEELIKIQNEIY